MKPRLFLILLLGLGAVPAQPSPPTSNPPETVVMLHGLGLGAWAMKRAGRTLEREGYHVINLSYDSLRMPLPELWQTWLPQQLTEHGVNLENPSHRVHFVTHSMGGILLRGWLREHGTPPAMTDARVVMFAPPNQGSTLVDRIGKWFLFRLATGVNGRQLSTAPDSVPNQLGPWPDGPTLGIIAGDRPINPLLDHWTGGPGDGKVKVEHTRLEGMNDHIVMPHSHTWIQYRRPCIQQVVTFLRDGKFDRSSRQP